MKITRPAEEKKKRIKDAEINRTIDCSADTLTITDQQQTETRTNINPTSYE